MRTTISSLIFMLIHLINSNPIIDGNVVCNLTGYFQPSNGYGWTNSNNQIICTCPDSHYEINKPCRICHRTGICGPLDALCSEEEPAFISMNNPSHFTCFCSSGSFSIGTKCPEESTTNQPLTVSTEKTNPTSVPIIITTTVSTTVITSNSMSTTVSIEEISSTTLSTTTSTKQSTTTSCDCRSRSSHLFLDPILIILLTLVYFFQN